MKPFANFNSIKVRLERTWTHCSTESHEFQFHKGTIRTGTVLNEDSSLTNFNSIKVRLELVVHLL